jgi:hypothetical protein
MSDGARGRGRPRLSDTEKAARKAERDAKKGNGAEPKIPTSDDRPAHEARNGKPYVAKEPLSDEQRQAVFFGHKSLYEKELKKKKAADASFKVACKLIKSENTKLADIKLAIELEDPEGSTEMRERFERQLEVARWVGAPVGTQFSFFEDRAPIEERVRADGKRDGLKGLKCEPPKSLPGNLMSVYADGWAEGQAVLASKITQQKTEDAKAFDDTLPTSH